MNPESLQKALDKNAKTLSDLFWENNLEWNEWLRMGVTEAKQVALAPKYQGKWVSVETVTALLMKLFQEQQAKVSVDRKQLSQIITILHYGKVDTVERELKELLAGSVTCRECIEKYGKDKQILWYCPDGKTPEACEKATGSEPPLNLALAFTDVKVKKGSGSDKK